MAKKTMITSILLTGVPSFAAVFFSVGSSPLNAAGEICSAPGNADQPAFPEVSEIMHCRDRFGGGAQIDQPCYVVKFVDADQKVIIPATEFCQATVAVIDTEETNIPSMPQG